MVNGETLAHLEDLGSTPDFLERLIGVFVADSLSLLAKMEGSVAARNFGEFRAHASHHFRRGALFPRNPLQRGQRSPAHVGPGAARPVKFSAW